MARDDRIAEHYRGDGIAAAIAAGLGELGKSPDTITFEDLAPADEFHIGGRAATAALCERAEIAAGDHVLDLGSGIGGPARFIAGTRDCRVTGIDLTPSFVEAARTLTEWTGQTEHVDFEVGSVLDLPFEDDSFDCAVQLHVGMNIEDKSALALEVARVLRPGGCYAIYDVMRHREGRVTYPVPWAGDEAYSFLATPDEYRSGLEEAGFVAEQLDLRDAALSFFAAQAEAMAKAPGPTALGLQFVLGPDMPVKLANLRGVIVEGILGPVEVIARLA